MSIVLHIAIVVFILIRLISRQFQWQTMSPGEMWRTPLVFLILGLALGWQSIYADVRILIDSLLIITQLLVSSISGFFQGIKADIRLDNPPRDGKALLFEYRGGGEGGNAIACCYLRPHFGRYAGEHLGGAFDYFSWTYFYIVEPKLCCSKYCYDTAGLVTAAETRFLTAEST